MQIPCSCKVPLKNREHCPRHAACRTRKPCHNYHRAEAVKKKSPKQEIAGKYCASNPVILNICPQNIPGVPHNLSRASLCLHSPYPKHHLYIPFHISLLGAVQNMSILLYLLCCCLPSCLAPLHKYLLPQLSALFPQNIDASVWISAP